MVDSISRHIYYYFRRKEQPTLKKLWILLKDADLFHGSMSSSLLTILKGIEFTHKTIILIHPYSYSYTLFCLHPKKPKMCIRDSARTVDEVFIFRFWTQLTILYSEDNENNSWGANVLCALCLKISTAVEGRKE